MVLVKADGIGLLVAGPVNVPRLAADWDLGSQQAAGLGPAPPFRNLQPIGCPQTIQGRGTDMAEFLSHLGQKRSVPLFVSRQPEWQHDHQPLPAGVIAPFPDLGRDLCLGGFISRPAPARARSPRPRPGSIEQLDGVLGSYPPTEQS